MKETYVRPALVNVASIASKVNACTTDTLPVWKEISRQFPGASLFAIDADPRSFEVLEKGHFDGRANVLISVPGQLRSGRNAERSFKIPTVVRGELSPTGEISISDISLSTQLH